MTAPTLTAGHRSTRWAQLLTDSFSPPHLVLLQLLVVGALSGRGLVAGLGWGLLTATLLVAVPYGFVIRGVRRGRFESRHVRTRQQRLTPLLVCLACAAVSLGVLLAAGGPWQVVALVLTLLLGITITSLVTLVWKVSFHAAVAAGTATVLTVAGGPTYGVSWVAAALISWSRLALREHTRAQVAGGALLGTVVTLAAFGFLR